MGDWSDPLRSYLIDYLQRHQPAYVALGGSVFSSALTHHQAETKLASTECPHLVAGDGSGSQAAIIMAHKALGLLQLSVKNLDGVL